MATKELRQYSSDDSSSSEQPPQKLKGK